MDESLRIKSHDFYKNILFLFIKACSKFALFSVGVIGYKFSPVVCRALYDEVSLLDKIVEW